MLQQTIVAAGAAAQGDDNVERNLAHLSSNDARASGPNNNRMHVPAVRKPCARREFIHER
jgi:hypothetical protein